MENWQQVQEIFIGAMRQAPEDRPVFLNRMCSEDKALRREVESLLSSYDSAGSFLETPAAVEITESFGAEIPQQLAGGQTLGHYEIIEQIGRGGMGEVYLAQDKMLDRRVAVKILTENFSRHRSNLQRFIREAKAASGLNHPNILVIHEIGETEDARYIVSEHIEGQTLREYAKDRSLTISEILDFSIQIAGALSAAHAANIVHRDIKPENIMVRPDGFVKVLDFGLAKLVERKNRSLINSEAEITKQNQTAKGIILGTVNYMSPEQARGGKIDERTDLFSLGVVLYEMITGRVPFEGETVNHTIVAILEKEPLLPENTPDELQRIVRRALTKDKAGRYQTAQELLTDLKKLSRELDIQGELERTIDPNKEETTEKTTAAQRLITASSLENAFTEIKSHKLASAIIAVFVLSIITVAAYFALFANSPEIRIQSIAVMPFVNESGSADAEYLSDGMTETLINSLSQIPSLNVKARSSVFRYKGRETSPQTIGRELNVEAVLIGRVVQRGDQLTLSLELIDAKTETALWGNKYERLSAELVSLQTEVARDVSGNLIIGLSEKDEEKVLKTYTTDPEAYKLYLKGRFHWNKRNGDGLKQATVFFNQALEIDPLYALAYSGLAEAYILFADYNAASPVESYPKARAAALRALEIDDSLAAPHSVLASYLNLYEWDHVGAEREYRRAIELSPNSASAHQWLGYHLAKIKRFDEAFAELRQAEQLDPLSPIISTNIGDTFIFARRYDEAIAQYNRVLSFDPNFLYARMNLGWALQLKGRHREAIAEFEKAIEVYYEPLIKSFIAVSLVKSGRRSEAIKLLKELKAESESGQIYVPNYAIANVYLALNEKDEAFIWMEKDIAERATYPTYFAVIPDLDPLRADPRFKDMLRRLNLPE